VQKDLYVLSSATRGAKYVLVSSHEADLGAETPRVQMRRLPARARIYLLIHRLHLADAEVPRRHPLLTLRNGDV